MRCSAARARPSCAGCGTRPRSRSGCCGRSATTPARSSTSSSATATRPSCGSSASRRACAATSRCSRRSRRCARTGASRSTPASARRASRCRRDHLRHALRRRLRPRHAPAAHGQARRRARRPARRRHRAAPHRGRAARLRPRRRARPQRADRGDRRPRHAARAPRATSGPTPRSCGLLRESVGRARQLVDGVLEYARAGEVRRDRVDLAALMAEVEQDLRARLAEAEATLEVRDLPEVSGDAGLLRRVLQNLVGERREVPRATRPPGSPSTACDEDGDWVVSVRDHGVGVPPEDADRIFGMFARSQRDAAGDGIGLAVSPPRRRGARRADLGRAGRGRRQRLPLHAAALTPGRPAGRGLQEARHGAQAAVVGDEREVEARRDARRRRPATQVPGEAHAVVVGVGAGGQLEAVAGELLPGRRRSSRRCRPGPRRS